jgi:hypothetical protein
MVLTHSQLNAYRSAYNRLPDDVDAAHQTLERDPTHIETIRGALRIIKEHSADDYLGLFLLHRHFECAPRSLFVERRYTPRKGHPPVLVTKGEPARESATRIAPHRLAIAPDGNVQALEFTTDATVRTVYRRFADNAPLARALGRYFAGRSATSRLGVGIYVRTGTMGKATSVFLEETLHKDRASVVHVLPRLPHQVGRAIPTLWTFGENGFGCCNGRCVAYCNHDGGGLGYCGHRKTGGHMVCV